MENKDELIAELIAMTKRVGELHHSDGIMVVGELGYSKVMMRATSFFKLFKHGSIDSRVIDNDCVRHSVMRGGVEFYCYSDNRRDRPCI